MFEIFFFSLLTNFFYYSLGSIFLPKNINDDYKFFYNSLGGVIFASFIALLLNFFTPLNNYINSSIFCLTIVVFLLKSKLNITKNEIIYLIISGVICFFLILLSNVNRPDAGLYHLPYVSILNEYKIIFGLNNLHSRFGHVSIIQYLSALNNNYFFKDNGVIIPLASIASYYYIYFANEIRKIYKKKTKLNLSFLFSLIILIYISFKLNGYDGFGNDGIAHLSFFYLISYILKLENKSIDIIFISLISVFIFLNKSTMIFVFIIPIFLFFYKYKLNFKRMLNLAWSFPIIFLLLWSIKNLIISGCVIYPSTFTCINMVSWLNINSAMSDSIASEAWAKAWPENTNPKLTMEIFITNFNWVEAWSKKHLIYIAGIIFPYIILLLIVLIFVKISFKNFDNKILIIKLSQFYSLAFFVCSVGSIFFLIKFPLYRYGYSYLISLIALIFIFFIKENINEKKIVYASKFIFTLSIIVFVGKQSLKIVKNYNLDYINKPWPRIYSFENNDMIKTEKTYINESFYYYFSKKGECMYSKAPCTNYEVNENLLAKKVFGYTILTHK
jgi:hypothetical protein